MDFGNVERGLHEPKAGWYHRHEQVALVLQTEESMDIPEHQVPTIVVLCERMLRWFDIAFDARDCGTLSLLTLSPSQLVVVRMKHDQVGNDHENASRIHTIGPLVK